MGDKQTVAILGASADTTRYSFKAQQLLKQLGHRVIPVSTKTLSIDGDVAVANLSAISEAVDTLTVYVRPAISSEYREAIQALKPARVIFNPGAENPELAKALQAVGIATEEACTLVLLRTHQF